MALDARILMGLQPVQREPYANVLAKAMQIKAAQQGMDLQAMQMEEYRRKAAEAQQAQARYQQYVQSIPSPQANALATLGGNAAPTVANAQRMPQVDPRQNELYRALQAGVIQPGDYLKEAYPTAPQPKDMVVGDALIRVGPQGAQELYKNPKEAKLPEGMRMGANGQPEWIPGYLEGRGQVASRGATQVSFGSPVPVQLPDGSIGYVQPSNRGGPVSPMTTPEGKPLVKPIDQKDKDLTEAQSKATTFLGQMRSASATLDKLNANQAALSTQAEVALAGGPANIVIREKAQQIRQAQDQWSEAFLRFKTGAAATQGEVEGNRKMFFPVAGDSQGVVAQKRAMRAQAERDMEIAAGRGAGMLAKKEAEAASQQPAAKPSVSNW